jgi:peptidoglycan-N-acetylglucosamine deacetylase
LGRSSAFYDAEIARTDSLLRSAGVRYPRLFRPPFGRKFIGLPRAVARSGYRTIMWDVEDDVAHHPTLQGYADDIVRRARPGSIILIHPMYRTNPIERAALPLVLAGLQRRGFRIVTVGELLAMEQ